MARMNPFVAQQYVVQRDCDTKAFIEARVQLHHALQIVAAASGSLLPPSVEDAHTNLGWDRSRKSLTGHPLVVRDAAFQLGLSVEMPAIWFGPLQDQRHVEMSLEGRRLVDLKNWVGERLAEVGFDRSAMRFDLGHELPQHAVALANAAFRFAGQELALAELASWLGNGFLVLKAVARGHGTGLPRCWPHLFDVTNHVSWPEAGEGRMVSYGLSLGDEQYQLPYYYVSPWPPPTSAVLPTLPSGARWHAQDSFSAVLDAGALLEQEQQLAALWSYIEEAGDASRGLL